MDCPVFKTRIERNREFKAAVRAKKEQMIVSKKESATYG